MAIQVTAEQRTVQATTVKGTPSAQRSTLKPPRRGTAVAKLLAAGETRATQLARVVAAVPSSKRQIAFVSAATLAATVFFTSGFMRTRAKEALRDFAVKAEDVRIRPVLLMEIAWELLADRRAVSSATARGPSR